jgi:hypothetical protein
MASATLLRKPVSTLGDLTQRDVYARNSFLRNTGQVLQSAYTIDGSGTPVNVATSVSTTSGSGGLLKMFVKPVSAALDTSTDTPVMTMSPDSIAVNVATLSTTGKVVIKDTTIQQLSTTINHDLGGAMTSFRFRDASGNVLFEIANNGAVSVAGILTTTSDTLVAGDLYTTGDTKLYGALEVSKTVSVKGDSVLIGTNSSTSYANAGVYVGASTATSVASLVYQTTPTLTSAAGWKASIPVVYAGSADTVQVGSDTGSISVWKNDKSLNTTLSSSALEFSSKWRLRYDDAQNVMVFEYRSSPGGSYQTIQQLRPPE